MLPLTLRAGSYHRDLLAFAQDLEVHAVFDRTWHLRTGDGSILTVTTSPWNGPLTVRIDRPGLSDLPVLPGMRARVREGVLIVGQVGIDLEGASGWSPELGHSEPVHQTSLQRDLTHLVEQARWAEQGGLSLGVLLGHQPRNAASPPGAVPSWRTRGIATIRRLLEALSEEDTGDISASALALLGLGPGLTPSGDDVLCGLLAGFHVLGRRPGNQMSRCRGTCQGLASALLPVAANRTTVLSRTLLRFASEGVATEPLLAVLCTLGSGGLLERPNVLLTLGHTSGSDMLTGVWMAGKAVTRWEEACGPALVPSP